MTQKAQTTELVSQCALCVDLDGTVISSDIVWECILAILKFQPLKLLLIPFWLLHGRAHMKSKLAECARLNVNGLPYRSEVLRFLQSEHDSGRPVVLVTACDGTVAGRISSHLGLFDACYGSEGERNLKGKTKAAFLCQKFGERGFDYVGDSAADLEVWTVARAAYVVGDERLAKGAAVVTEVKGVFEPKRPTASTWTRALRGQHWAKNVLLFLPLLLAHSKSLSLLVIAALGFVIFGTCASGMYVLNDLLDLHSDRDHPWKRNRPFAAGEIPIWKGLLIALVLLAGSVAASFALNPRFGIVLLVYAALTMWYSLHLKRIVLIDAFVLSGFYTIRIIAGGVLTSVPLSHWFLAFSLFLFLSLAMAKRYSEMISTEDLIQSGNSGRGYIVKDRELLLVLGVCSSFSAAIVFTLYVHSQEVLLLYRQPKPLLILTPIILYWLSRVWLQAHRGELHDDPVTLALRDRVSYAVAAAVVAVIAASMILPA